MKKILSGIALLLSLSLYAQKQVVSANSLEALTVRIESGLVKGVFEEGVDSFKGIPYAAAPVGEFRWRPPQPVPSWQGVRNATQFCDGCAQAGWPRTEGSIQANTSEDCLFLNLWRLAGVIN